MNKLEFRAWHKKNKKYYKVNGIDFNNKYVFCDGEDNIYNDVFRLDEVIIEQYTGLKDKNGKKIYEGDIVKEVGFEDTNCNKRFGFGRIHSVAWDNIYLQWFCLNNGDIDDGRDLCFVNYKYALEVVGNIHENPKLLGKK